MPPKNLTHFDIWLAGPFLPFPQGVIKNMGEKEIHLTETIEKCYHCGEECLEGSILFDDHPFCCAGCKTVYELLGQNDLTCYYDMNIAPGSKRSKLFDSSKFDWLDDPDVQRQLVQYADEQVTVVTFYIPGVHCSSCIYLLENIYKINPAIVKSQVNFLRKEARLTFRNNEISLKEVVGFISQIGYEPQLNLNDIAGTKKEASLRQYYMRIGVAFFCFGNIMLLSFPEYLGISALSENPMRKFFGYANFALSLPVLLYSAGLFFRSAWTAIRERTTNMDIPIVLGMLVMFFRSAYEIFVMHGAGYMDTLASLTLLMLIGRMFQNKTYDTLSFDRDYKSYFPVSVSVRREGTEQVIPLIKLKTGDTIIVRNQELVPADTILMKGRALIDYSFVTGESVPVVREAGDMIYAGGKQTGSAIEMEVIKDVSHSYLTQLWNNDAFKPMSGADTSVLTARVSRYFTPSVIILAALAGAYWIQTDLYRALSAFTAILIITCPCALALSMPFTLGNVIRITGRNGVFLKNTNVIEKLSRIKNIVFDKTGTLTDSRELLVAWQGEKLRPEEQSWIASLIYHSSHPLSRKLFRFLNIQQLVPTQDFIELQGFGIEGWINKHYIRAGAGTYAFGEHYTESALSTSSKVHVNIDGVYKGYFEIKNEYRKGFESLINSLGQRNELYVLSGDNDSEKKYLSGFLPENHLLFDRKPIDKLDFIREMQAKKPGTVMMIGDGLNDAGALMQSDAGIVVSDDTNNFSPACDGIIDAAQFEMIPGLLTYARVSMRIVKASFIISILYNMVGISFAARGTMSPIVAAVLMPVSSITIISFTSLASYVAGRVIGFK